MTGAARKASFLDRPLREVARGLRDGQVTAEALAREALARVEATEPALGAYKLRTPDEAVAWARNADAAFRAGRDAGLFQGIPAAVKDLYGVPGLPTFAGSSRALPEKWQAAGPVARALLEASPALLGKTHTVEFAFGGLGLNNHWPTPRNPWDAARHRAPGGSSSGAGVALCQGAVLVSLGTDTAGSVRIPATLTGNVGYKPTIGRWSTEGIVPLSLYLDTPGVLARTVDDAAAIFQAFERAFGREVAPREAGALRIGVPEGFFFDDCDAGIAEGVRGALAELERAGHRLVPIAFPEAERAFGMFQSGGTAAAELLAFLTHELPGWIPQLDPVVGSRMRAASEISAVEFLGRKHQVEDWALAARARFDAVDVIATPTAAQSPPDLAAIDGWEAYRPLNLRTLRNTCVANFLKLGALTLPVALDAQRMPVGLQVHCRPGDDALLFAAGLAFEKVLGTARQRLGVPPAIAAPAGA